MTDDEHAVSPPMPDDAGPVTDPPPFRPPVRPATESAEASVAHQADAVDAADDHPPG